MPEETKKEGRGTSTLALRLTAKICSEEWKLFSFSEIYMIFDGFLPLKAFVIVV